MASASVTQLAGSAAERRVVLKEAGCTTGELSSPAELAEPGEHVRVRALCQLGLIGRLSGRAELSCIFQMISGAPSDWSELCLS